MISLGDVSVLNAEVSNFVLRHNLRNTHVWETIETERERNNRMAEFWNQYHGIAKLNELPPMAGNITKGLPRRSPAQKPKADSGACQSLCFDAAGQWGEIKNLDRFGKVNGRPPKMHVQRGMRFTPGSAMSMKWEVMRPADGTRAALMRQLRDGNDLALEKIENSGICPGMFSSQSAPKMQSAPLKASVACKDSPSPRTALLEPLRATGGALQLTDGPSERYVQACQRCLIIPTPLPCVTGHSGKLLAHGRDMTDNDLRGVAAMIQQIPELEEVDISENPLLTENAIVPFLERLHDSAVRVLNLSGCKHMNTPSMDTVSRLLAASNGLTRLKTLNISRLRIAPKSHLKLAGVISGHRTLEIVHLADTGLGTNDAIAEQCVRLLMSSPSLHTLDIGWNSLGVEEFKELGATLLQKQKLRSLCLANCGAMASGNLPPPITFFLECLSSDQKLTQLDLSLNCLDFRSMLVLEDSLEKHKVLRQLNISENPLGTLGIRSALRLLSTSTSGLISFDISGSSNGSEMRVQTFNMTYCGGRYSLELERPYHRSILRMLYKMCERMAQPPDQMFSSLQYSSSGWVHASKDSRGIFQVPKVGKLCFFFNIEGALSSIIKGVKDYDFNGFVTQYSKFTKICPAFNKIIPLLGCWKLQDGQTLEQSVFLSALAKDFQLSAAHLEHMVANCTALKSEAIESLLPCVTGGQAGLGLSMRLFPSCGELCRKHEEIRSFLDFNVQNPTGHYKLRLEVCTDYAIAQQLMLLDRWEAELDRKLHRKDTSQRGNGSHIRNEFYMQNDLRLQYSTMADFKLPEIDVLEFDYMSGKRCPADAAVVGDQTFKNILSSLFDAGCNAFSKLEVLRKVSHHLYLTSTKMRALLGSLPTEAQRAEAFVTFYLQIVDMYNAKVFRVRFSEVAELQRLQERLGCACFFPFIQPENAKFSFAFNRYDERIGLSILLQIAMKEGWGNLLQAQWIHSDGKVDPLPLGIPASWQKMEQQPQEGTFNCVYTCAPEYRKFAIRTELSQAYAAFPTSVRQEDVMWWTGLLEPPFDVLVFMTFLMGTYKDAFQAFSVIDGPDGNGEVTLSEFRDGVRKMKCKKFNGKDEAQRIDKIFRYLDPGGEGNVSKDEWAILSQLWNEFDLCITEFVQFLVQTFGDLDSAWQALDDDESGELDKDEWMEAVMKIGYFGPAECVFGMLDHSGDGSISLEEFNILQEYADE